MRTRFLLPIAASSLTLLLSGCLSSLNDNCQATQTECYDRCDTYCDYFWGCWDECFPVCGEYCVDYIGSNQCGSNWDCASGEVCTDEGLCRPGDAGNAGSLCDPCRKDSDCGERGSKCVTFGSDSEAFCGRACDTSRDCPTGYSCVNASGGGQCVPSQGDCGDGPQGQCRVDSDCLGGKVCSNRQCVDPTTPEPEPEEPTSCTTSAQCDSGETCIDSFCRGTCTTINDCRGAELCVSGQCIPAPEPECTVANDCGASGFLCVDSTCVARCTDDSVCAAGQTCNGVYCD